MSLNPSEFVPEVTVKDLIVLHFTAGTTARSAFDTWREDPRRIATSYLVDRGWIDLRRSSRHRPGHHTSGVSSPRSIQDRRSISDRRSRTSGRSRFPRTILRCSTGGQSEPPASPEFTTRFCRLDERNRYVKATFRGKDHFAAFPDVQSDAVAALVHHAVRPVHDPADAPPLDRRFYLRRRAFSGLQGRVLPRQLQAGQMGPRSRVSLGATGAVIVT